MKNDHWLLGILVLMCVAFIMACANPAPDKTIKRTAQREHYYTVLAEREAKHREILCEKEGITCPIDVIIK